MSSSLSKSSFEQFDPHLTFPEIFQRWLRASDSKDPARWEDEDKDDRSRYYSMLRGRAMFGLDRQKLQACGFLDLSSPLYRTFGDCSATKMALFEYCIPRARSTHVSIPFQDIWHIDK